jgi:oligoribonuclease NrnB/cAMP/cGMP phosphodiesterase (DHH superfamily)
MMKFNKGGSDLIISHIADIDGLSAAVLAKIVKEDINIYLVETNELSILIKELNDTNEYVKYQNIYITDLPVRNDAINILNNNSEFNKKITHYDHHTSEVTKDKPSYLNVVIDKNGIPTSGTELFYDYLLEQYPNNKVLNSQYVKDFVEGVRSYDTWDFKRTGNQDGVNLTELFSIIGIERYLNKFYAEAMSMNKLKFEFDKADMDMINIKKEEVLAYIEDCDRNLMQIQFGEYNVGVVFAELYRSSVGNVLSTRYKDKLDFIMIINLMRNSISLRTVNDVDLGLWAKSICPDAGGQQKAAGIPITQETKWILDKTLNNLNNIQKTK